MVATAFGFESILARGPCCPVFGNPVAEGSFRSLETSTGRFRVIPGVVPLPVDEKSHADAPFAGSLRDLRRLHKAVGCGRTVYRQPAKCGRSLLSVLMRFDA